MIAPGISSTGVSSPKYRAYFAYFRSPAGQAERAPPPLDVVIPGDDENGRVLPQPLQEGVRRLKLPVPGALAHVAGDHGGRRPKCRQEGLERLDLRQVGVPAEMKIGKMGDADRGVAHAEKLNDTGKRAKGAPSRGPAAHRGNPGRERVA